MPKRRSAVGRSLDAWQQALHSELLSIVAFATLDDGAVERLGVDLSRNPSPHSLAVAREIERDAGQRLRSVQWSTVQGARLIVQVERYFAIERLLRRLLPSGDPQQRFGLLVHAVWRQAEEAETSPQDAVAKLVIAVLAGPLALAEVERRVMDSPHVGIWAGLWYLLARWHANYPAPHPTDTEIVAVTDQLRKTARRHIRPSVRADATPDVVAGSVAETLLTRLPKLGVQHPLDAIALGLDGMLDVMPTAIGHQSTKHVTQGTPASRKRSARARGEIEFVFHAGTDFDDARAGDDDARPARRLTALKRKIRERSEQPEATDEDELAALVKRRDELDTVGRQTVDAVLREAGRKTWASRAAASLGISRQQLNNRLRKIQKS